MYDRLTVQMTHTNAHVYDHKFDLISNIVNFVS